MKFKLKNIVFIVVSLLCFISTSLAQPIFHWVETESDTVSKYGKFEVRASISGNFNNPYDYAQVIVFCYFISPGGTLHSSEGFFYQDYTMSQPDVLVPNGDPHWRIRFAPDEPGNWAYELVCLDVTHYNAYPVQPFYCEDSSDPGFVSTTSTQKLVFDNGEPFFGIGTNLAWREWDQGFTTYLSWLDDLSDNGANFCKLTMAPWWTELEWQETGLGNYDARQNRAWAMDRIIERMDERDIYVQLNFLIHDELRTGNSTGWAQNPYNTANGGPCGGPQDFLVIGEAKDYFKRKIRYINARWGYSPHVQSWEVLTEADKISAWDNFTDLTISWLNEMAAYTASVDKHDRPVSSGFAIAHHHPNAWNNPANTFTQLHLYDLNPDLEILIYNFTRWYLDTYQKPVIVGEFSLAHSPEEVAQYDPDGISFHNCIWSSAFSGSSATAMSWWWDNYLIPRGLLSHFQPLANFIDQVGPPVINLSPEMLPTTADNNDMILIDPDFGNSLEKAPEHYFTIDPSGYLKPLEIYLGEVLYGFFFNSSRNPPTFKVNYTKPGEFTVITGDVAFLSKIRISLNGAGVLEQNASPNSYYTISVPAGEHEIKVANVGNGYLDVAKYRLLNYSPRLRAFAMRNEKHALGWIQNKQYNWEYVSPNGPPQPLTGGKIYFDDFDPGLYSLDWYGSDGNFVSSVPILNDNGEMVVDSPEIIWDAAFELNFISPVVVDFVANITSGDTPLTVQFTDQSFVGGVAIDSRRWEFGDGFFSVQQNPTHTYQVPGVYDVKLKLVSGNYADSLTKQNYITATQPLVADFAASDTSVLLGELVYFTDLSLGNPTSWFWIFGDNAISTLRNPSHLYTQPGFYTVSLLIQKEGKSDLIIKNNFIEVYETLIAGFETDKTLCLKGEAVQFTDLSQGNPDSWAWNFGDGGISNAQNPGHFYNETGIYPVKLKVTSAWRTDSITKQNLITVVNPLIADFEADRTFVYTGQDVQFTDLTTGSPLNWEWDFGDGNTSQLQHPEHNYQQAGNYSVKLKVTNEYLEDSLEITNFITVAEPLVADFVADTTDVVIGQEINFTDLSSGSPTLWVWDFGDTTNGINQNPMHKYWFPGDYSVNLMIFAGDSTNGITKEDYIHVSDSLLADFYALPTEVNVGEIVQFTDISRGNPFQWEWDFGDAQISPLQNPEHSYGQEGNYSVSLKVYNEFFEDSTIKVNYITVIDPLIANFVADTTKVLIGQIIQFSDLSSGSPTFWVWDFGDESNGISPNPVHFYEDTGAYNVSLQVFKGDSTDIETKENYIQVRDSLIADFYTDSIEVRVGDQVQFYDNSRGGPNQWFWNFGTLKINPSQNPVYTYQNPGIYAVQLIVKNDFDTDTLIKENYITVLPALISQNIILAEGWSGVATYVNPLDPAIEGLLSPLGENHIFSMNHEGIYWPDQNTNTIINWDPCDGLIVKMAAADTLTVTGESELSKQAEISAGWNILPVVNPCPELTTTMHVILGDTLALIKEIAGTLVFWPEYGINTLEMLEPGKSYFALANFETGYQYRECDGDLLFEKSVDAKLNYNPWNDFTKTPQSHLLAILPGAIKLPAESFNKMVIGIFNEKGVCSGILNLNGNSETEANVLVAFSHDAQSSGLSGFAEGERMECRIFVEETQSTYLPNLVFDSGFPHQDKFSNNGLSGISEIEITGIIEDKLTENEIFIYPNPGNGIFYIDLSFMAKPVHFEVLNSRGGLLKPAIAEMNGITSIDLSKSAKGIYLVKIISGQVSATKKVVLR